MNVFYEEEGSLKAASVMAESPQSLQVETPHGKRSKIKSSAVLFRFESPAAGELLQAAQKLAEGLDVELLWSACTPEQEVGFESLAETYVGHRPSPEELAAVLLRLQAAPVYFYRKGRGRFRPAPEANVQAALAGLEKKRQLEARKQEALAAIRSGQLPEWILEGLPALLYHPDKNTWAYKTLEAASADQHQTIPQLLVRCGALRDSRAWHEGRFQFEYFGPLPADLRHDLREDFSTLPLSPVRAFSIDDAFTTEIDDAFSVTERDEAHWEVGIHIAAPGLGFAPGSPLQAVADARLSTVYMPGSKIAMLPDQVIAAHTLQEGRANPVLSLLLTVRKQDLAVVARDSRMERVVVAQNLRLHVLETCFDPEQEAGPHEFHAPLRLLWQLAQQLARLRGVGERPPQRFRDFTFVVENDHVTITERARGAPLDMLVAELMIEVNASWASMLATAGVPALYRTQVNGKTRLSVDPAPHEGLGVAQYVWSSSPLRRYVDLVNQWQMISLLTGQPAPFSDQNGELTALALRFETAYDAYAEFQRNMERYWSLRWLQQERPGTCDAVMLRDGVARFDCLPLTAKVQGAAQLLPGTRIRVQLDRLDEWDMTVVCHLIEILEPLAGVSEP